MEQALRTSGGRVAIIGAGFSGTALAVQLLRRPGGPVTLIERSGTFGPGLAYGTSCERHLLNVRSGRMSLFPDQPDHFVRWLAEGGRPADPDGFARRADYGRYIQACLTEAEAAAPGRLSRITGEVVALTPEPGGAVLTFTDGRRRAAEAVVLATGNPPPGALPVSGLAEAGARFIGDPWALDALEAIGPEEDVLLIGTGLTAVDVLLALEAQGWRGSATAISRRGLLPRVHGPRGPDRDGPVPSGPLSGRLRQVRRRAARQPWTAVMDELRPHGQALWLEADDAQRRRFLRHLRPWWDVHRHRMAPEIGATVERLRTKGRLRTHAGRLISIEGGDALQVRWRLRGGETVETARPAWIINCTGPEGDPSRAGEPLVDALLRTEQARPDPLRLGLDVDPCGRLLDGEGRPQPGVWVLGPPTRGALWEIVAVPEIRAAAAALADQFAPAPGRARAVVPCAHLDDVGESYREHMGVAFWFGTRMLGAGAACMVHGVAPWLFTKTASATITELHDKMVANRSRARRSAPHR